MNSEERQPPGQTAYRRTNNILRSPTLSNYILRVFGASGWPSTLICLLAIRDRLLY